MEDHEESVLGADVEAAFEAGIKLGALFHQFLGSPVDADSAGSLEEAMASAMGVQPHVKMSSVTIDRSVLLGSINDFGYTSLSERMLKAEVVIDVRGCELTAVLDWDHDLEYPLMRIRDIRSV